MALQRNNFRCPRDGGRPISPLKIKPLDSFGGGGGGGGGGKGGVVVSHAELPPRQRKRVQVGSTNVSRSVSTSESLPSRSSHSPLRGPRDDVDESSAVFYTSETNINLRANALGAASVVSPRESGLVVLSEKRQLHESTLHPQQPRTEIDHEDLVEQAVQQPKDLGFALTNAPTGHPSRGAGGPVERTRFLEARKRLFDAFVDRYGSVRAVFKAFDKDSNGCISYQRFAAMVEASEVGLSPADVQRVFRHVDQNGDNTIEFQEFSEMFTASEYTEHASAYSPTKLSDAAVAADPTSSLSLKFRAPLDLSPRARERMKELRVKVNGELLHKHGRDLSVHGGKTENLLIYAFKQFDGDNDGFLSYDQVKSALGKDYLQLSMAMDEMDEMVRLIDRNADEKISMKEFVQYFGAGKRELPTDLIDNGRRKELAALHYKANTLVTPREEVDPAYVERRRQLALPLPLPPPATSPLAALEPGGCMQENLLHRTATSLAFHSPLSTGHLRPRAQSSHAQLSTSQSTPSMDRTLHEGVSCSARWAKRDGGPALSPLTPVLSQDRHAYWRKQRTDWTRVGVGGDGMRSDAALFGNDAERFQTTTQQAFSPMHRGVNSGDVFRDALSTSESEALARAARRQAKHARTELQVAEMATRRAEELRLADWRQRAKVRLGAETRFEYLDKIHDQQQRVAMREQQTAKRHGGARFHRMWAGSAESQFNSTQATDLGGCER